MRITIDLNISSEANQDKLFRGLENWQQLGLLSHEQVRQLCEKHLSVPLPPTPFQDEGRSPAPGTADDFAAIASPRPSRPKTRPPSSNPSPTLVPRLLQSFVAEISVIWLLFLGVFLVVVSSGVLAATQWRNFPPIGQYGILFAYTLAFWGASVWIGRQERLQLTARMLAIATLLIIPVNFWMMDGLGVARTALGLGAAAIASLILTVIPMRMLQPTALLVTANAIVLGWLHWGWGWDGVPLIATYIGTIGTAVCLLRSQRLEQSSSDTSERPPPFPLARIAIAFAVLLLMGRAIFAAQVPSSQLGLAFGICGWLLHKLSRPMPSRVIWERVGTALLIVGWLVSVGADPPWQAIAVSLLGLSLLWQQLRQQWRRWQLTAFLVVGLQSFWLLWFLLPSIWREAIIVRAGAIAGSVAAWELASLGGMLYVGWMVALSAQLRRWEKPTLAQHTEGLALGLGGIMIALAWAVPLLRSLTLLVATLLLVVVIRSRPAARFGVNLTHAIALAAVLSWISALFPDLSQLAGASILLALMGVEWLFSLSSASILWRQSAWYAGLILAAIAYPLLLTAPPTPWNLVWLTVPILLTGVAVRREALQPRIAAWLTVPALLLQVLILDSLPPTIITLGIGTVLLFIHSRQRSLVFAILTVGFGLSCVSTWIYQEFSAQLTPFFVITLMAIALWGLWGLRHGLKQRQAPLRTIYAIATDTWAIGLCILLLLALTAYTTSFYHGLDQVTGQFIWAAALTTTALAYRLWQQPTQIGWSGLAWAIELLAAGVMIGVNPAAPMIPLAIATLALGFAAQLTGDIWSATRSRPYTLSSHAIPLTYAGLGLMLAHSTYTEFTGLYTLAAALIWVGVGRRQPSLQPLTYIALAGISIASYELLVYQLLQAEGGNAGDGVTLLAGLAALIAVGDRLLSRWLLPYLRLNPLGLNTIAHVHWLLGSGLAFLAVLASLSDTGLLLWLGVSAILAGYALASGNRYIAQPEIPFSTDAINRVSGDRAPINRVSDDRAPINRILTSPTSNAQFPSSELWTYTGIIEAVLLLIYGLYRLLPDPQFLLSWGGAIAAGLCLLLYPLPWERWGWSPHPWKRSTTVLPGLIAFLTFWDIALQTVLIVGAFYAWLAKSSRQLRLSYLSIVALDWAVLRFLGDRGWLEPLWLSAVIGGSVLYIVQLDPELQDSSDRERRHLLRLLATAMICLTALYQAEIEPQPAAIVFAVLTVALSIGLILLGLVLRIRAFLYVGTATFILRVLRLLWLFVSTYSALLWAVGIVLGLVFIWIAATFEARRTQVNSLMQNWTTELSSWE